jgi:molybdate transport system substrate-binding protein
MSHRSRLLTRPASITRRVVVFAAVIAAGVVIAASRTLAAAPAIDSSAPLVAAASDLKFALEEILERCRTDTGIAARIAYGSSGTFARQIMRGAPYEVFLSADEQFVHELHAQGLTRGTGDLYAIGRLALFAPTGSPLVPDPGMDDLARRVASGQLGRFAIANPEHAPYGRAAEQALRARGLWTAMRPRLVLGENVAQAAQFASGGDTEGGLVAHSLVLSPELRRRGTFALIPDSMHAPLRQRMVLLQGATPAAERLYEYLRSPPSREILARYGFVLPAE